jgi:hypothetical protein
MGRVYHRWLELFNKGDLKMIRSHRITHALLHTLVFVVAVILMATFAGSFGGTAFAAPPGDPPCFTCIDDVPTEPFCIIAESMNGNWHEDWWEEEPFTHYEEEPSEQHEGCVAGGGEIDWCNEGHGNECLAGLASELGAITEALQARNYAKAAGILGSARALTLNAERSAIQGWNCTGRAVIRHMPIDAKVMRALQDAVH